LGALKFQHGMFSLLPIDASVCQKLRDDFGIYMTGNARINVVGVSDEMESYFVESIARALGQSSQS
jgi:aspartate/tyrosine/aromatic aminotransferase